MALATLCSSQQNSVSK